MGDRLLHVKNITFNQSVVPATGKKRLETDGTNLFYNGSMLNSGAETVANFTINNNLSIGGDLTHVSNITASRINSIVFNSSNITVGSNIELATYAGALVLGSGGIQAKYGELYYNGAYIGGSGSNVFQELKVDTINSHVYSNITITSSNVIFQGDIYASNIVNATKLALRTPTVDLLSPGVVSQEKFITTTGGFKKAVSAIKCQSYDANGGKVLFQARDSLIPGITDDGNDLQLDIAGYRTSETTGSVFVVGQDTSRNVKVGIGVGWEPAHKFVVGTSAGPSFSVDTVSNKTILKPDMVLQFDKDIIIKTGTGNKIGIGTNNDPAESSIAIGNGAAGFDQGERCVAIGFASALMNQGTKSIAIGASAAQASQGASSVAIGENAGQTSQGINSIAIGSDAGTTGQATNSTAIGFKAGNLSQGERTVALGYFAGKTSQGLGATAIGQNAAEISQGEYATAIGAGAGATNQGSGSTAIGQATGGVSQGASCTAIGTQSGSVNQGARSTAIGYQAGVVFQGIESVAVGYLAGYSMQAARSMAIGYEAGKIGQSSNAMAIGYRAGYSNQGARSVAIGYEAGSTAQLGTACAIGFNAGKTSQGEGTAAVGASAGETSQGSGATAIGQLAGNADQGTNAVSIGYKSGYVSQGASAIAIGDSCARTSQSSNAIAIGTKAGDDGQGANAIAIGASCGNAAQGAYAISVGFESGKTDQQAGAVAIGQYAGRTTQGTCSIAIGQGAGKSNQAANTIVINASGADLNGNGTGSRCYIKPIANRAVPNSTGTLQSVFYDTSTFEVFSSTTSGKTFVIDHPDDPNNRYLVHACLEGPEVGVYYRGRARISSQKKFKKVKLPDYVRKLIVPCSETIHATPIFNGKNICTLNVGEYDQVNNCFTVYGADSVSCYFNWIFYAKRKEMHTAAVEPLKTSVVVKGNGPYTYIV